MDEAKALSELRVGNLDRRLLGSVVVLVFSLLVLIALAVLPFFAFRWMANPFIGAFIHRDLAFAAVQPSASDRQPVFSQGDRLVALGGETVSSVDQIEAALSGYSVGQVIPITAEVFQGGTRTQQVTLQPFPQLDRYLYFYAPYFVALIYFGAGMWVFNLRRREPVGLVFAFLCASAALTLAGFFDFLTSQQLDYLWIIALPLSGAAMVHLFFVFSGRPSNVAKYVSIGAYLFALSLLGLAFLERSGRLVLLQPHLAWRTGMGFVLLIALVFTAAMLVRSLRSASPIEKQRARLVFWASSFSFAPLLTLGTGSVVGLSFSPFIALLPLAIFPVAFGILVLRYGPLKSDVILSRTLLYTILTVVVGVGYSLVVAGLGLLFGNAISTVNPFVIGAFALFLAVIINPVRRRLQRMIEASLFRGQDLYAGQLQTFRTKTAQVVELEKIISAIRQVLASQLQPVRLHIFVYDSLIDYYTSPADESGGRTTDIRFAPDSALADYLSNRRSALFIDDPETFPSELQRDKVRIALLGAQLFVAINGQNRLLGWFALGPRRSGASYTVQELDYLSDLSRQAASALERAQVVADKDRRVREMNVLTRVAQGVNITLEFDDILELIYAQSNQVIPFDDFAITMLGTGRNALTHTFYVERHERLRDREGVVHPQEEGLEKIVINSKQPIITDDYARECRDRGVLPASDGLFAWMGVPLNAGAETIGLIGLGSRNSSIIYTQDQHAILQAIADQAAGAIVKARLLNESDQRARQLATLNEVARSLTSTLEIDPLLNSILESAVEILNCEAGSLLLQDEDTGELVFEVVVGPVAEDLTGKRLQPGVGLVGKAVNSTAPVIVNNVETSAEWFQEPDKQTGFITRGLLVVPMMVKQRVIGVIEVINKKDFTPFDEDDQELLMAFTGQAAIAIENARLYTQTDQKLASRVEELSVLQRVDRELNTSLDVRRAMQITLDWAMRQSEATAGLIGILQENQLSIVASQGYAAELEPYQNSGMPLDLPALREVVEDGQVYLTPAGRLQNGNSLLPGAQSQLVIPISREADVIGLLFLESSLPDQYSEEARAFLVRLSDHASIAISNAQLYTAVQQANIAKSDFVSFVSHELKTPMTSIKGYADLLSAGSVGEITEAQANFLATIRTNVDRMSTLVSDLADISRIEAGRLKLDFAAVPVNEVVDEVVRSARASLEENEQSLIVEAPEKLPQMWGDRNRLIQILSNLLSNAIKYTPEGGEIVIRAEQMQADRASEASSESVHITVQDDGIGIKEEDQKNIFQQYFRTEEGKETAPGTGLGLNITRYLVEMQGGEIWFESVFGQGSTFHITVPIAELGSA